MSDLLIRNISSGLKKQLEKRARKNRRSLSDEAKRLLDEALVDGSPAKPLGAALADHFKGLTPVELDIDRSSTHRPLPEIE